MYKSEKGITIALLIITVLVMVILAGIAMTAGSNLRKQAELTDRVAQMKLIQTKAKDAYNEYLYRGTALIGQEIALDSPDTDTGVEKWYKLDKDDMKKLGIDFTPTSDLYYCIKYNLTQEENNEGAETDEIDIYYSGGYKSTNGNTYYTLNKLKDLES